MPLKRTHLRGIVVSHHDTTLGQMRRTQSPADGCFCIARYPFTPLLLTLCTNHFWNSKNTIRTGTVTSEA